MTGDSIARMSRATPVDPDPYVHRSKAVLPGPVYYAVLAWIHARLRPSTYLEVGVKNGESLRMARPETCCIGIDPAPVPDAHFRPNARVFRMTSDEFFATHDLTAEFGGHACELAFIDGLHLFEQALRDFAHLERHTTPRSIVLVHDCLPLDAETSSRTRATTFHSGDVWKMVFCLREIRPDLTMTIIPTAPTGLCVIRGLDPSSTAVVERYDECVERYIGLGFADYLRRRRELPPLIANTKTSIASYLEEVQLWASTTG